MASGTRNQTAGGPGACGSTAWGEGFRCCRDTGMDHKGSGEPRQGFEQALMRPGFNFRNVSGWMVMAGMEG